MRESLESLYSQFKPEYTPQEMFELGIFGGTYFRPIYSSVINQHIKDDYKEFSWLNHIPLEKICSSNYNKSINLYGVSCSTSLEFWESKNWITKYDPRGWVQWYCRYYNGRRCEDDARQIKRWLNIASISKGRFRRKLNPTLKIKQVLLHWASKSE